MSHPHWTNEDWTQAATYGTCELCGEPRTAVTYFTHEQGPQGPVTIKHVDLLCSHCGKQAT